MTKIIVIGSNNLTLKFAGIIESKSCLAGIISIPRNRWRNNSLDLSNFAKTKNIPYFETEDINSIEAEEFLRELSPDYIISGWPNIIKRNILEIPKNCVIGTHPTNLPKNRGRHPMHWLLSLGIRSSVFSFFKMDAGVDSGPVLHQEPFELNEDCTIHAANEIMESAGIQGLVKLAPLLIEGTTLTGSEQRQDQASYWRKKTPDDIIIDPRLATNSIKGIIQSFSDPYPCARLIVDDFSVRVININVQTCSDNEDMEALEPGKIIRVENHSLTLKVGDGIVKLVCHEYLENLLKGKKYIYPPTYYVRLFPIQHREIF